MEIRPLLSAMRRSKTGPLLVAAQVAVTLAVLVNIAYVIEQRLADAWRPSGMDFQNMLWVTIQPTVRHYNYPVAVKTDLDYLNALPGVVAATPISTLPQTFMNWGMPLGTDPKKLQNPGSGVVGAIFMGTDRFIDALGLKLVAGRNFAPDVVLPPATDITAALARWAPQVIITQALAQKLFPGGNALGKTLWAGVINKPAVIIGIAQLMRANPVPLQDDGFATRIVILPEIAPGPGTYVVRTQPGRRDEVMARIDRELAGLTPGRFISHMEAYDVTAARARRGLRSSVIILAAIAVLVLLVTVVGMAGLAAFHMTRRTRQLGIRRALGARKLHIVRYFLVEGWITTTGGVAVGCLLAVAASVELSRMYQLPRLPLYYLVGGVLLLWVVGLIAVLVPALRAASIPPAIATRTV